MINSLSRTNSPRQVTMIIYRRRSTRLVSQVPLTHDRRSPQERLLRRVLILVQVEVQVEQRIDHQLQQQQLIQAKEEAAAITLLASL